MNRNNKIFQIVFSILILGIAFLLLFCIGICSPKTVVRPAVVDEEACPVPPPDMPMPAEVKETGRCAVPVEMSDAMHFDFSQIQLTGPADLSDYTLRSVKNPTLPRQPDAYNKQLQSYIYYSRANEPETDILQLSAVTGLFILNIVMICNLVYIIESPPRRKNP